MVKPYKEDWEEDEEDRNRTQKIYVLPNHEDTKIGERNIIRRSV